MIAQFYTQPSLQFGNKLIFSQFPQSFSRGIFILSLLHFLLNTESVINALYQLSQKLKYTYKVLIMGLIMYENYLHIVKKIRF